jgi:hypothetical protein
MREFTEMTMRRDINGAYRLNYEVSENFEQSIFAARLEWPPRLHY